MPEWGKVMDLGDYPKDYFTNFGAIVCNFVSFVFPGSIADPLIRLIAKYVLPAETPEEERKWLVDGYLPEIIKATKNNSIPFKERVHLLYKLVGVIIKLIFAFAFQE